MSKPRVIDVLRKAYPGVWRFEWPSRWVGEQFEVQGQSSVPDQFDNWYVEYVKTDTQERVPELLAHWTTAIIRRC